MPKRCLKAHQPGKDPPNLKAMKKKQEKKQKENKRKKMKEKNENKKKKNTCNNKKQQQEKGTGNKKNSREKYKAGCTCKVAKTLDTGKNKAVFCVCWAPLQIHLP